jgi:hypothetical protein
MDATSDIAVLFSKLPYNANQYQEIGDFQQQDRVNNRWNLIAEINRSINQTESEVAVKK